MQESNISVFEEAYAPEPKVEQWIIAAALGSVVLHFGIMLYLLLKGGFSTFFIFLYLLASAVFVVVMVSYWLEHRPCNRKHLTLNGLGVRYGQASGKKNRSLIGTRLTRCNSIIRM